MKRNLLAFLFTVIFLIHITAVLAVDFTPQGDINLRDTYNIENALGIDGVNATFDNNVTADKFVGGGEYLTGVIGTANSSEYWDSLNTYNVTQMENNAGTLSIILSWFSSHFDDLFSAKDTDDLTEGSTNLYDNQSWNESHAASLFSTIDEPLWTDNFTNYNDSWTTTDSEIWDVASNGTLAFNSSIDSYIRAQDIIYNQTMGVYVLAKVAGITWSEAVNGTLMLQEDWDANYTANNDLWLDTGFSWAEIVNGTNLLTSTWEDNYTANNDIWTTTDADIWDIASNGTLAFNTTMGDYVLARDVVTNDSMGTYARAQDIIYNTTMGTYVLARDVVTNASMGTYTRAQDVIYNTTMGTYVLARDVVTNDSMGTYARAQDVIYNTTMGAYVLARDVITNSSMGTYVQAKNDSLATWVLGVNTTQQTWADNKFLLNTGDTATGTYEFNGGWASSGLSIIGGDIYAQTGYFYNISGLNVTTLAINGSILPDLDDTFDIGNLTLRWKDIHLSGIVNATGSGDNYFAGNVGVGTTGPSNPLHVFSATNPQFRISYSDVNYVEMGLGTVGDFIIINPQGSYESGLHLGTSAEIYLANTKTGDLNFSTDTKLAIDEDGNVGIGTTAPASLFETGHVAQTNEVNLSNTMFVNSTSGNVGIGTASPDFELQVAGDIAPEVNATSSFGSVALKWLKGWFVNLDVSNDAVIGGDLNVTGNWTGNSYYGEVWYHNHTATELNFAVDGLYYNLTFDNSLVNGMTFDDAGDYLEAQIGGAYKTNYMASGNGQNNHVYYTDVTVNGVVINKCESHKKMTAGGDIVTMTGSCLLELSVGDKVKLATADVGGTGTGNYYSSNLNLIRVGN